MKTIFWGLLITCLHFNIGRLDLIPSFLGWYFVLQGLRELPPCTARDSAIKPVIIMVGSKACAWCLTISNDAWLYGDMLDFLCAFVELYILWLLIKTVKEIELILSHTMPANTLLLLWKIQLICTILVQITWFIQSLPTLPTDFVSFSSTVAIDFALLLMLCKCLFLYHIRQAAKAYEEAMAHPIEFLPSEE